MVDEANLRTRLDLLNARILSARGILKNKKIWNDGHHLTSGELNARYEYLRSKIDADIRDLTVHNKHVGALETAVIGWIEGLNISI